MSDKLAIIILVVVCILFIRKAKKFIHLVLIMGAAVITIGMLKANGVL